MGRRHEAADLLRKGLSPKSIARQMGVTVSTVIGYLYHQVGEGKLQRSDLMFSIDPTTRALIESVMKPGASQTVNAVDARLKRRKIEIDFDDLYLYLRLRKARVEMGDLYEEIRSIEVGLHSLVRITLQQKKGKNWWRALPVATRCECAKRREEDPEPAEDPFCYTMFIELKKIFDALWGELSPALPKYWTSHKKKFLDEIGYLNGIRNAIMHPVKGVPITADDFVRVRSFSSLLRKRDIAPVETWASIFRSIPSVSTIQ